MSSARDLQILRNIYLLCHVDDDTLQRLQETLRLEQYPQGELILRQGAPVRALYVLLEGSLARIEASADAPPKRGVLLPGNTLGELEIILDRPWSASARALQDCTLMAWERGALLAFLEAHPMVGRKVRYVAHSRQRANQMDLPWLASSETVFGLTRKHGIVFVRHMIPGIALALFGVWQGIRALAAAPAPATALAAGAFLLAGLLTVWNWIDWRNDFYAVTNRRILWRERILALYEGHEEALMPMVLSVSATTSPLGRLLGYGDLAIRTYAGEVRFQDVPEPDVLADMIEGNWRLAHMQKHLQDEEGRKQAIQHILEEDQDRARARPSAPDFAPADRAPQGASKRSAHWGFETRYQEGEVITYRKHWAVLLRRLTLPSSAALAILIWLTLSFTGGISVQLSFGTYLASGATFLLALLWWFYEYVDWANDIYQVTPEQIVDLHRKPLSHEVRKVAPIENILGTKVDRSGPFGLLLNFGSVITNIGTEQFIFDGVFDPSGVQRDIVQSLETRLAGMKEVERRQRREEMIEWLRAYHRETNDSGQAQPIRDQD
jgi:hypothetical protein